MIAQAHQGIHTCKDFLQSVFAEVLLATPRLHVQVLIDGDLMFAVGDLMVAVLPSIGDGSRSRSIRPSPRFLSNHIRHSKCHCCPEVTFWTSTDSQNQPGKKPLPSWPNLEGLTGVKSGVSQEGAEVAEMESWEVTSRRRAAACSGCKESKQGSLRVPSIGGQEARLTSRVSKAASSTLGQIEADWAEGETLVYGPDGSKHVSPGVAP